MKAAQRVLVFIGVLWFASCLSVFGAEGHIVGPSSIVIDGNSSTVETATFEIVVDKSDSPTAGGFEWQVGLTGQGMQFNVAAGAAATQTLATDSTHVPAYFALNDSSEFLASTSFGGIRCGDMSNTLAVSNPIGKSLGYFVVEFTDEMKAMGTHTLTNPPSFILLGDFESTENLTISDFTFTVVPEPTTLCLMGMGAMAMLRRRRK